jgi:hypothetical protein
VFQADKHFRPHFANLEHLWILKQLNAMSMEIAHGRNILELKRRKRFQGITKDNEPKDF